MPYQRISCSRQVGEHGCIMPCAEMIEDDIEDSWFERVATVFAFVLIFIVVVVMGAISAVVWLLNRALSTTRSSSPISKDATATGLFGRSATTRKIYKSRPNAPRALLVFNHCSRKFNACTWSGNRSIPSTTSVTWGRTSRCS